MSSLSMAQLATPPAIRGALLRLGVGVAVTAFADWLFYLHPPGVSVAIFVTALGIAVLATNSIRCGPIGLLGAVALLVAALLPSIEAFGLFSFALAIVGSALFALLVTGWSARPAIERIADGVWLIVGGPFQLVDDVSETAREARTREVARHGADWLKGWIVPLGVGGLFLALFAAANPVIESWFSSGASWSWQDIDVGRVFSWLVVFALIWAFLHVRRDARLIQVFLSAGPPQPPPIPPEDGTQAGGDVGVLFGRTAIVRSLVLFNALFAVQTAMDVAYLWSGMTLPAGLTYASYAQRGAYALMAAALLAGAFVLAAMRPGSETERARPIRALVFVWIAQTVVLVVSSALRLDLYVDAYSLTEWRCAAFVWMLLVAVGLVLIMTRIALGRSNAWLVWRNGAVLALTLYVCGFIDFSGLIADFNVAHSREVSGAGQAIDVAYLCDLGPAAIPALDVLATKLDHGYRRNQVDQCRHTLTGLYWTRRQDWRAFTFRDYRLRLRLDHGESRSVDPVARSAAQANGEPHGAPHPGG
jgi:hypothetical protein